MGGRGKRYDDLRRRKRNDDREFNLWDRDRAEQEYQSYDFDVTGSDFDNETEYVQTGHSFTINDLLRDLKDKKLDIDNLPERERNNVKAMDKFMRPLSEDVTLHRFITPEALETITNMKGLFSGSEEQILENLRKNLVGGSLQDAGFASSSYDPAANVFTSRGVMIRVQARKGTKAIVTANHTESEVVLHRNAKMDIINVSREDVITNRGRFGTIKDKKWVITVQV